MGILPPLAGVGTTPRRRHLISSAGNSPLRVIIDTDPGVDDAIAILLALATPGLEVVGLTTVGGNVPRARATRNALALLQAAERPDIPVAKGAARPLTGRYSPSVAFHGPGGLSVRLPEPTPHTASESATDFLAEQISAGEGRLGVVALGPLTNLAWLEQRNPGILAQCSNLVVMGGAVESRGNVTPRAEFNFHSDPLAASRIFGLDAPVILADLAACRQVGISREQAGELSADSMLGRLALRILHGWFARDERRQRFEFYDPLAVALAVDPGLATMRNLYLSVITERSEGWGESVIVGEPGPVAVADVVDSSRFFALLGDLFRWRGL